MVSRTLLLLAVLSLSRVAHAIDTDYVIAARYAPVIFQETGTQPKADAITSVDFDGDWATNNNWDNMKRFDVPAYVYYSVVESTTHYFITYAFYHPRDYATICLPWLCHENDMEGAGLTVDKSTGVVVHLETKAHLSMDLIPVPHVIDYGGERRVAVYVEKGGHGVRDHKPGKKGKFFVYSYAGRAESPGNAKEGHFGYELVPIETTIWARRDSVGKGQTFGKTYEYVGTRYSLGTVPSSFAGEKWAYHTVTPPWSWGDGGKGDLKLGDWFFDPALAISRRSRVTGISTEYIHNPFLGILR